MVIALPLLQLLIIMLWSGTSLLRQLSLAIIIQQPWWRWPGHLMELIWLRAAMIKWFRFGTRTQAALPQRLLVIAIRYVVWPGRWMARRSLLRPMIRRCRPGRLIRGHCSTNILNMIIGCLVWPGHSRMGCGLFRVDMMIRCRCGRGCRWEKWVWGVGW